MSGLILLRDVSREQWLRFESPRAIVAANEIARVIPALERIQAWNDAGGYAAGFIAYEAAPAFDDALVAHTLNDFPLVWFGLYDAPTIFSFEHLASNVERSSAIWTPNVSRETYNAAIASVREYIARGDTYQVNYTMRLRSDFDGDAAQLFSQLVRAQPNSYAAFMDTGRFVIASASPELFLLRADQTLTMKPMKGTAPRGRFTREDRARANWLHHSEKNRAENVMILDMARNDLGKIADVGSVHVTRLWETERYPTVWQMTSTVQATSAASFVEILRATFPCASITGAPKARTMQIIRELEPEPRRVYTGAIGFLAPQRHMQFNVAIRTALLDRATKRAEYGVGGGIVWDSEAGDEYDETRHKARILTEPPFEFSLIETLKWTPQENFWLLDYHLRRLRDAADYFDFPFDETRVLNELERGASLLPRAPHKARLQLARDGALQFSAALLDAQPEPVRVALAQTPVNARDKFLYHKTTQRAVYDAALAERGDADDVLLWNERGEITETCIANLVVQFGAELFTPPIECGLLGGTYRAFLLAQGKISERVILWDELRDARALFRINSVRGWQRAEWARVGG
ncbi:MAG: Isochorismate synthase MenF [Anaerolineae bacterium]|nr:Isochorismate synthase MenF [Anaerolineae bacterium]